jgi:hypothetical protein
MFNYRVVIAQVELLRQIFLAKEKDYAGYAELISNYDGPFKALAAWLMARDFDKPQVDDIIGHLDPYIKKGRLKTNDIIVSPSAVKIKNSEPFEELDDFANYVHGHFPTALPTKKVDNQATERTPVISGQGIQIFEVNNPNDSRELASDTSWCIAYPGQNNMWTSYRSGGASSFFIVFDENPPLPELRKVAVDFNSGGVDLTDINNHTGSKLTNGMDWNKYSEYLKEKGIDIEAKRPNSETGEEEKILQNKPLTDEEKFFLQYYRYVNRHNVLSVEDIKKWARGVLVLKSDVTPEEYYQSEFRKDEKELFIEHGLDQRFNKILEIHIKSTSRFTSLRAPIQKDQIISIVDKMGIKYSADVEDDKTISLQDLIEGKQTPTQPLSSYDFGNYDKREPITEITLRNNDSKNYLTKFVGLGYVLPKAVFEYVLDLPDGKELLIQYVDTGITIPDYQIEKIKEIPSLFRTYVRKQLIALSRNSIQDASILIHLDPNDEKTRNTVLDSIIPKDVKNVYLNDKIKILEDIENIPQKWLDVPQLGVLFSQENITDPLAIKVAIAAGMLKYLQDNLTIENVLIYLHDIDAINTFKDEAIAQKYLPAIFEPFYDTYSYKIRWNDIRIYRDSEGRYLRDNPRLNKYRAFGKDDNIFPAYETFDSDEAKQLSYERAAVNLLTMFGNIDGSITSPFKGDINFWMYLINNYQYLLDTVFKNIGYENVDTVYYDENDNEVDINDVDTTQVEVREVSTTEYSRERQRRSFDRRLGNSIPVTVLQKQEILNALPTILSEESIYKIISRNAKYSDSLKEYLADKYLTDFSSLDSTTDNYIFEKDNPIIRKITQNGFDVDKFVEKFKKRSFYYIYQLSSWNPKLVNSISDDDFLKIVKLQNSFGDYQIHWLEQNRPEVLVKLFYGANSNWLFSYEQKQYIGKNVLPKLQQPEQIEEPVIEEPAPTSEAEEMPEEPTTASIKLMVKIARILDLKKEYRLADKLTYMF